MLEMIQAELRKAVFKKRFWGIFLAVSVLVPLLQVFGAWFGNDRAGAIAGDIVNQATQQISSPYNLARNHLAVVFPSVLLVLAALMGVFFVGEERQFKMWKTILVAQPDRAKVLSAKFVAAMIVVGAMLFGGVVGALVFGSVGVALGLSSGFAGDWGNLLALYGLQWLVLSAPIALAFLASWFIPPVGLSVIAVAFVPSLLESIARGVVFLQLNQVSILNAPLQLERMKDLQERLPKFFFTNNVSLGRYALDTSNAKELGDILGTGSLPAFSWPDVSWSVAVAAVYLALFIGVMLFSFTSRDIHE